MNMRKQAEELFLSARERRKDKEHIETWTLHSQQTARVAETIARCMREKQLADGVAPEKAINSDLAYSCGYLHDVGRAHGIGLKHPIAGYHMLMELGLKTQAQVSMTHTYYDYRGINRDEFWVEFTDDDLKFTQEFMENVRLTEYDRLIQLADNMAHYAGVMSIENRFSDILVRHNIREAGAHLRALHKLKTHFDEQAGINIYELFKDDIIRTTVTDVTSDRGGNRQVRKYHDQD